MLDWYGEKVGVNMMRKHFGWYVRGFEGASLIRKSLVTAQNKNTMMSILDSLY